MSVRSSIRLKAARAVLSVAIALTSRARCYTTISPSELGALKCQTKPKSRLAITVEQILLPKVRDMLPPIVKVQIPSSKKRNRSLSSLSLGWRLIWLDSMEKFTSLMMRNS